LRQAIICEVVLDCELVKFILLTLTEKSCIESLSAKLFSSRASVASCLILVASRPRSLLSWNHRTIMPWDWNNNTWSLSYSPPRNLNVVRKQKTSTPPLPKYTRLPALLKTIKEVPDVTVRNCLATFCTISAGDAKHIGRS